MITMECHMQNTHLPWVYLEAAVYVWKPYDVPLRFVHSVPHYGAFGKEQANG